jgi:hypothetical protein
MVDWGALAQVVISAFAATVAVTLLFTAGVLFGSGEGRTPAPRLAIAGVAFAASLALVVLGLYVMLTTK